MAETPLPTQVQRSSNEDKESTSGPKRALSPLATDTSGEPRRGSAIDSATGVSPLTPHLAHVQSQHQPVLPTVPEATTQPTSASRPSTAPGPAASQLDSTTTGLDGTREQILGGPASSSAKSEARKENVPPSLFGPSQQTSTDFRTACDSAGLTAGQTTQTIRRGPYKDSRVLDPEAEAQSSSDASKLQPTPEFGIGETQGGVNQGGSADPDAIHSAPPLLKTSSRVQSPSGEEHPSGHPKVKFASNINEPKISAWAEGVPAGQPPPVKESLLLQMWNRSWRKRSKDKRLPPPGPEGFTAKQKKKIEIEAERAHRKATIPEDSTSSGTAVSARFRRLFGRSEVRGKQTPQTQEPPIPPQEPQLDNTQRSPRTTLNNPRQYNFQGNSGRGATQPDSIRDRAKRYFDGGLGTFKNLGRSDRPSERQRDPSPPPQPGPSGQNQRGRSLNRRELSPSETGTPDKQRLRGGLSASPVNDRPYTPTPSPRKWKSTIRHLGRTEEESPTRGGLKPSKLSQELTSSHDNQGEFENPRPSPCPPGIQGEV